MLRFIVSNTYQHMLTGDAVVSYITLDCAVPELEKALTAKPPLADERRFVGVEVLPDAD